MPILANNGFRWVAASSQEISVSYMGGFGETDGVRIIFFYSCEYSSVQ